MSQDSFSNDIPVQQISHLKQTNLRNENQQRIIEEDNPNYYNEYCRLYLANNILNTQFKELNYQKNQLINKLNKLQKRAQELSDGTNGQFDQKKRRIRRAAAEIARYYKCQLEGCGKSYGSEGSLNQHIKIKHPQCFKHLENNNIGNIHTIVKQSDQQESL